MRRSLLALPLLLALALGAYLLPERRGAAEFTPPPVTATLPDPLSSEGRALFQSLRPAVVRVDTVNTLTRSGGLGTGFFISEGGDVLTAYHVVKAGQLFQITTLAGERFPARVVAFDEAADVALLRAGRGGPFPFLDLAARPPRVGEEVLAIGNSGGDFLQPRRGTLLRLDAEAGRSDFPQGTLEMNAPLAQGDSGGPVIGEGGGVLGVVSYIRVSDDGQTRASYAVPVPAAGELIARLRAGEKLLSPLSALVGLAFDEFHSGQTDPPGAVVLRVTPGSAAARAGLRGCESNAAGELTALGDVILSIGGVRTPDSGTALDQVKRLEAGDRVTVDYLRGGERGAATLTITGRPLRGELPSEPCTRG